MNKNQVRSEVISELQGMLRSIQEGGEHVIVLNDYQVANLRGLLHALGVYSTFRSPLNVCNTGDWLAEIFYKLPYVEDRQSPNVDAKELARRAREWNEQQRES